MSYDYMHDKVFGLEEEFVATSMRACGSNETSTSVNLPAILFLYRTRVMLVAVELLKPDHDERRSVSSGPSEAIRETGADGVSLEELLQQSLQWW